MDGSNIRTASYNSRQFAESGKDIKVQKGTNNDCAPPKRVKLIAQKRKI